MVAGYVGDGEVLLQRVGCEEDRDVVDLAERVRCRLWRNLQSSIARDVEGDVEKVAAHGCEWLGLDSMRIASAATDRTPHSLTAFMMASPGV